MRTLISNRVNEGVKRQTLFISAHLMPCISHSILVCIISHKKLNALFYFIKCDCNIFIQLLTTRTQIGEVLVEFFFLCRVKVKKAARFHHYFQVHRI